ncbi:hypothetical protein D3C84_978680 [compost metagenome]
MDTYASAKQNVLVGESKFSFQKMLQNIQVGDTLQHNGCDVSVVTKALKEKNRGFLIEISLGSATLEAEQVFNYEEMLWMIQAGNFLVLDGATRVVREKLFTQSGSEYSPTLYLMKP